MDFKILDFRASDFIDMENYFNEIVLELKEETAIKFLNILCVGDIPKTESETESVIKEYVRQVQEIKETFTWLYNPPQQPSNIDRELRKNNQNIEEFANDYNGYVEIIYLLCKGDFLKLDLVGEMKTQDFLFWGEYLVRKRFIENVK